MKRRVRLVLAVYLLLIFLTLPLLPPVAEALRSSFGAGPFSAAIITVLAAAGLAPLARLGRIPPDCRPAPACSLLLLLALAAVLGSTLASSPVGRVHLAEYALLGFLAVRALPGTLSGRTLLMAGWLAASVAGLLDETAQHFLPNRVFDWYDVALNSGSALLGALFSAWWEQTGRLSEGTVPDGPPGREGCR